MSKLSRNDPCHCGSGKKYKKCCMPADNAEPEWQSAVLGNTKENDDFILIDTVIDYGVPLIDEKFLSENNIHEISAARMIYTCLLSPEIERQANVLARQSIKRSEAEQKRIETAKDLETGNRT